MHGVVTVWVPFSYAYAFVLTSRLTKMLQRDMITDVLPAIYIYKKTSDHVGVKNEEMQAEGAAFLSSNGECVRNGESVAAILVCFCSCVYLS